MADSVQCVFRLRNAQAAAISLVGPFNNWSTTANLMTRIDGDRWETQLLLPPGRYSYCYFALEDVRQEDGGIWLQAGILNSGGVVVVPAERMGSPENN